MCCLCVCVCVYVCVSMHVRAHVRVCAVCVCGVYMRACGVCMRSRVLCVCVSCRLLGTCELTNLSNLSGRPAIIYKWISFSENLNIVKKFDILDSRVAF